ncbi:hypothetical protein P5V15_009089 [Pogonomyrmex californicus]
MNHIVMRTRDTTRRNKWERLSIRFGNGSILRIEYIFRRYSLTGTSTNALILRESLPRVPRIFRRSSASEALSLGLKSASPWIRFVPSSTADQDPRDTDAW